jgi:acyl-CoA thioesterase II
MTDLFDLQPTEVPGRWRWSPDSTLLVPGGYLQGGAGLGAALAAMECHTGRTVIWANAQYVSFASGNESFDVDVRVAAAGNLVSQARCSVSRAGVELIAVQAALGSRPLDYRGVWTQPPSVGAPDDCPTFGRFRAGRGDLGDLVELRLARGRQVNELDGQAGDGMLALWVRFTDGSDDLSTHRLAVIGDFMPLVFANALGIACYGNSLDNTIRFGPRRTGTWVLLDCQAHQVHDGVGHGRAFLWDEQGTLLAEVNQSAIIRLDAERR